jgi:hypothetical protein
MPLSLNPSRFASQEELSADTVVRRQALFRAVNEQIRVLADGFGVQGRLDVLCECAREDCWSRIDVTVDDFEAVRRFPTRFLVERGHAVEQWERLVESKDSFDIVEKIGSGAAEAIRLDRKGGGRKHAELQGA